MCTAGKISIKLWNVQKAHVPFALFYSNFHRDTKKLVLILIHSKKTHEVYFMGFFVITQNHPIEYMENAIGLGKLFSFASHSK